MPISKNSIFVLIFFLLTLSFSRAEFGEMIRTNKQNPIALTLSKSNSNDIKLNVETNNIYDIITTGKNPFVTTEPIRQKLEPGKYVLSFEYFCPKGLDKLEIFFGPNFNPVKKNVINRLSPSEGWVAFSIELDKADKLWSETGNILKVSLGNLKGARIQIRNIELRLPTEGEKALAEERKNNEKKEVILDKDLINYLIKDYSSAITSVSVEKDSIKIEGISKSNNETYLCEVPPYQNVTEDSVYVFEMPIKSEKFSVTLKGTSKNLREI